MEDRMFTNKEFSRPTDLERRMKMTPASSPREFYIQRMDGGYKDPSTLDPGDSFYTRPNVNRMFESSNLKPYNEPVGVMQLANLENNPIIGTIMEGYEKVKPYIPEKLDEDVPGDFYGYEAPVGPGTLTFGTDRDFDNFYGGYQFSFEDGGIVDTPQAQDMMKKELSDEQKDYLYDFMLDFMMKEKMREQQEMEGRVPKFNYFDMEV
tara:strand:- start:206 stop:826 length:621 start_codon:yes stop_codon:yes gene_type:complete